MAQLRSAAPTVQPVRRAELGPGQSIEVIGLRRWSISMIDDSLAKYAPGESLASHACIGNLRDKLGFVDADISRFVQVEIRENDSTRTERIMLLVREPQDSARIHRVRLPMMDDSGHVAQWKPITAAFRSRSHLFTTFASSYLTRDPFSPGRDTSTPEDSAAATAMLRVLAKEHSAAGYARALRALRTLPSNPDRAAAALILSRFPERDEAWYALLAAATEDHQMLSSDIAMSALDAMSRVRTSIDWRPVLGTLHDVLDGRALPALSPLIQILNRTGVRRAAAPALLRNGGEMLTSLLELSRPELSAPAHTLLVSLRGEDLGTQPDPWRRWIATLR